MPTMTGRPIGWPPTMQRRRTAGAGSNLFFERPIGRTIDVRAARWTAPRKLSRRGGAGIGVVADSRPTTLGGVAAQRCFAVSVSADVVNRVWVSNWSLNECKRGPDGRARK